MRYRSLVLVSLFAGMAGAAVLSAQVTAKFKAARERLRDAAVANQNAQKLSDREILRNRLLNPFTGPAARIQKVLPGGSIDVTVRGEFPAGTTILSERDDVTVSGAAQSTTTYSARLTIPADAGPGFVRLWGFTPLGIEGPTAVALVETFYRFDLKSPNGYVVKVAPLEKAFTIRDNKFATVKYRGEFYKPGESTPFETLDGDQTFDAGDEPHASRTPYAGLEISFDHSTTSPQAELERLSKTLGDPKATDAQRNAAMTRIGEVQRKVMEEMTKALQTDPASLDKTRDDFGCGMMQVYPRTGGFVEGTISCGKNFNDGVLKVSGTMTPVR